MGPWFDASRSERQAAIHEEINRLPRADRTVLILCGIEGRLIEQAATELRRPVRTVARRLSRALELLRVSMARRYYGIPAGTWDADILQDLGAIVPQSLIQSTVAAATCGPSRPSGPASQARNRKLRRAVLAPITSDLLPPASGEQQHGSRPHRREDAFGPRRWEEMKEGDDMSADEPGRARLGNIQELLARIKNGDDDAARELLTRYEPKIRLVVRRQLPRLLRSRFDSLDFLQSVWGSFFHKIRTGENDLDEEQNLITFLAWAARNKVIDEYRRAGTQKQNINREEPLESKRDKDVCLTAGDTPSQLAQARETYQRLRDLLPDDRQVILELKAAGYSCREIGDRIGMSERTVQRVLEDLKGRARLGG